MPSPERFLHEKYGELQQSEEIKSAVRRKKAKGERAPNIPEAKIKAYLERFDEILNTEKAGKREYGVNLVKNAILDLAVPLRKKAADDLPENFFDLDKKIAREQGHGDIEVTAEMKEQIFESTVKDQEASLSLWLDYLASKDAMYPTWLKYYAIRSITGLAEFDKEKHEFKKRSKNTRSVFPDLNREALAYVLDAVEKQYGQEPEEKDIDDPEFKKILQGANFAKLYAYAIEKVTPASAEQKETIEGEWIKYNQGSNHAPLFNSLQGHGTGWCTAGEATAQAQLEQGDFYVYYSQDEQGNNTIPRIAIRLQNNGIAEIRGINYEQNLEPALVDIAKEKAQTLPGHEQYEKKSSDMKFLTAIEKKMAKSQDLTKDELKFLYEIDNPIEGFGYQKDPRIKELRNQRDKGKDRLVIFECEPSQIAGSEQELKEKLKNKEEIKAYVGPLFPSIFKLLPQSVEHIYTEFPEGRIRQKTIKLGTGLETKDDFIKALKQNEFEVNDWAKNIMGNPEFTAAKKETEERLIILSVADLGFKDGAKIEDIYKRAEELGLEICPAQTGPQLRLQYKDQPMDEYCLIGMKSISDSYGDPYVFSVSRGENGSRLSAGYGRPDYFYHGGDRFAFVPASNS